MAILIAGAAGFIGFHLAKRMLKENQTVFGFDNPIESRRMRCNAE